jgi:hypothetical protein
MTRGVLKGGGVRQPAGHQRLEQLLGPERGRRGDQSQGDGAPSSKGDPGECRQGDRTDDRERAQSTSQAGGQPPLPVRVGAQHLRSPGVHADKPL